MILESTGSILSLQISDTIYFLDVQIVLLASLPGVFFHQLDFEVFKILVNTSGLIVLFPVILKLFLQELYVFLEFTVTEVLDTVICPAFQEVLRQKSPSFLVLTISLREEKDPLL